MAVLVALIAGAIVFVGLRSQERPAAVVPSASASASGSASAATATAGLSAASSSGPATGTPPTGFVFNDDFGFLVTGGDGPPHAGIRRESGEARLGSVGSQIFSVSPDGTQIAFFTLAALAPELRVVTAGTNAERSLLALAPNQRGGGIAWSSDGAALLFSTDTGGSVGGGNNSSTLNIYELAAGGRHGTTVATETNTGWFYRPIAWDRSQSLAAAGLTGEGGFMGFYVTIRITADNTFAAQRAASPAGEILMGSVSASSDAKLMLGGVLAGRVSYWPLASFTEQKTASGTGQKGARWQPGSHRIGFLTADNTLVLFQADDGSTTTAITGIRAGANLATFRADGAAVVLFFFSGPTTPAVQWDYTLYRLSDGANVNFKDLGGLTASVRLR